MDNYGDISYSNKGGQVIKTVSKIYCDVLANKPSSYYKYENYAPQTDDINDYSLIKRIGHGKYSIVFEGLHEPTNEHVVIKMLKPVRKRKVKREIKILECLRGGVNIVSLLAAVNIPQMDLTALVFELLINHEDFKNVYLTLSESDSRFYLYELMRALDFCHSKGIMHRDVKPHNIIIDQRNRKIRLIDWGLAEFYHPGESYNVRVASRYFKGPELLVDYGYYDYSLDIWSLGCVFASMLFRKEPFFHGNDNQDQLLKIVKVLGTAELYNYLKRYNIYIDSELHTLLGTHTRKSWQRFLQTEYEYLMTDDALHLLESMLKIDHMERITASEALQHPYFDGVHMKSHPKLPTTLPASLSPQERS